MSSNPSPALLERIDDPKDLKKLSQAELVQLATELRHYIIEVIANTPGHLASSLGCVELAIALHYVFDTPNDKLIWDVGHQAYPHKILTGRREAFHQNRCLEGLSGFPKMDESPYDAFGTGHSSTSISAALGMSIAAQLTNDTDRQHVAIIGDGAMTGGMAFEALNHAGVSKSNIIVILNDNGIAIDKSVGGLSRYFTHITSSRTYNRIRNRIWNFMGGNSRADGSISLLRRILSAIKALLFRRGNLFENIGFRYFGPIDGHHIQDLVNILSDLKHIQGPKLLHIVTTKGKGLEQAEQNPILYHAPGKFNSQTGALQTEDVNAHTILRFQDVFGYTMVELAQLNPRIVGITPAMPTGCSLNLMMELMPDRAFDVGIAEQHAVTFAAGLAAAGLTPFCNIYSSFMQRAFDQVVHDVALQKLPVIFCLDRAGLVGEDGPTHHGIFDLAYFRPIPNLIISAPLDEVELRNLMFTAQDQNHGPFVIRYPRGRGSRSDWKQPMEALPIGKARQLLEGRHMVILSLGPIGQRALKVCQELKSESGHEIGLVHMRFLKPLDEDCLHAIFKQYPQIITLEDACIKGGLASAISEFAHQHNYSNRLTAIGLPDTFIPHGSVSQLEAMYGLDATGIRRSIQDVLSTLDH